jgi:hypothetical protein
VAVMLAKIYEALIAANVPQDKALAASEELAGYTVALAEIRSEIKLIKWMVTANTGLVLIVLGRLFFRP